MSGKGDFSSYELSGSSKYNSSGILIPHITAGIFEFVPTTEYPLSK